MDSSMVAFTFSTIFLAVTVYFYFFHGFRRGDGSARSKSFFETTPAKQLAPRLSPLIQRGYHLIVVSADGSYPDNETGGMLWIDTLQLWLNQGLKVSYLIVGGKDLHCRSLAQLALSFPNQLSLHSYISRPEHSDDVKSVAEDLYVTHPVFLLDSSGSNLAMWLERFHSPESSIAMNVSYVAPRDIEKSHLVEKYKPKVELLMEHAILIDSEALRRIAETERLVA